MCDWPVSADPGCWFHGEEPIPPNAYRVCLECGHCYVTRDDLVAAVNELLGRIGVAAVDTGNEIYTCPMCNHDF